MNRVSEVRHGARMRVIEDLDQLAALIEKAGPDEQLYVRWSRGVEDWWGERSARLWVARRLYDYCHLRQLRGPDVRPWVLVGDQCGRGPDNEPLVICQRPIAWVSERALHQADEAVEEQSSEEWGPLHRADE
jgi:hypothetical protein